MGSARRCGRAWEGRVDQGVRLAISMREKIAALTKARVTINMISGRASRVLI
jgi:hypothetical protein